MRSYIYLAAAAAGIATASETADWTSDVTVTATSTKTHTFCPVTQTPVTTCGTGAPTGGDNAAQDAWWSKWQSEKSKYASQWENWGTASIATTTSEGSGASSTGSWGSSSTASWSYSTSGSVTYTYTPTYTSTSAVSSTTSGSGSCATYTPPKNETADYCNSAADRSVWCDQKDISSDYYSEDYSTGVVRQYHFTITNTTLTYDGTGPKLALAINGQVPGPVVEANWGDTVEITVVNMLQDNSTSIHWHGIRQQGTNSQDGVPGVTECGIAGNGGSRTYRWKATSYGTSWYHSHTFAQYGDGIRGPIVIHGPATANYDYDMGTVMIDDTFDTTTAAMASRIAHIGPAGFVNYLINGKNKNPVPALPAGGSPFQWGVKPCRKHLFRIINSSSQNSYIVSFDSHTMQVISADFVPIVPYETTALYIANGQRYDVIVAMDQAPTSYFVRAVAQTKCPSGGANNGLGTANAQINYEGADVVTPISSTTITNVTAAVCMDEPLSNLVPFLKKSGGTPTTFSGSSAALPAGALTSIATNDDGTVFQWFLNNGVINVDYQQPTLKTLSTNGTSSLISNPLVLANANQWYYLIVQNQFFVAHPLHKHGSDMYVLGNGLGTFTADMVSQLNFENPARRDTFMLQGSGGPGNPAGWTVIGIYTDNPGAWLMHCHITWHLDGGLALQYLEAPSAIPNYVDDAFTQECSDLASYETASPQGSKLSGQSGLKARDGLDVSLWNPSAKLSLEKYRKRYAHRHAAH